MCGVHDSVTVEAASSVASSTQGSMKRLAPMMMPVHFLSRGQGEVKFAERPTLSFHECLLSQVCNQFHKRQCHCALTTPLTPGSLLRSSLLFSPSAYCRAGLALILLEVSIFQHGFTAKQSLCLKIFLGIDIGPFESGAIVRDIRSYFARPKRGPDCFFVAIHV